MYLSLSLWREKEPKVRSDGPSLNHSILRAGRALILLDQIADAQAPPDLDLDHLLLLAALTIDRTILPPTQTPHRIALVLVLLLRHILDLEAFQIHPHGIRILAVGVVLALDLLDLEAQRIAVQMQGGDVAHAHVQAHVVGVEHLRHRALAHAHEFLRDAEPAVCAHDRQGRDVAVLDSVRGVFFHFGEHVPDNFGVGGRLAVGPAHDGHEGELRPCQGVVQVVFQEVVLREVGEVALLDGGQERDVGGEGRHGEYVDHCGRSCRQTGS